MYICCMQKYTDEYLIQAAKQFSSRREMRSTKQNLMSLIYRRRLDGVAFSHMEKERQYIKDGLPNRKCTKCGEVKDLSLFYRSKFGIKPDCKSCSNEYATQWRLRNPERSREIVRKSSKKYPEKVRERANAKRRKHPHVASARDLLKRVLSLTGERKSRTTEAMLGYSADQLRIHIESQFKPGMSWENRDQWHIDHIIPINVMIKEGITCPKKINALSNLRPLWAYENLSRARDGSDV